MKTIFDKKMLPAKTMGVVLLVMGASQIISFPELLVILHSYQFFEPGLLVLYASALILAETIAGMGLLLPSVSQEARKYSIFSALVVSIIWAILGVQAFLRGIEISNTGYLGGTITIPFGWWILIVNSMFVFGGYFLFHISKFNPQLNDK